MERMSNEHAPLISIEPTPLEQLHDERLSSTGVELYLKRDDLIHPRIPGNKWRKLKYNIEAARADSHDTLLTFGGAFSNHIYAVANAGEIYGFRTIGLIRGEEHRPLNPVLQHAVDCGMELHYVNREDYRQKATSEFLSALSERFGGNFYLLPEGGSNSLAVQGSAEIIDEIDIDFDVISCPSGTGGTLAGIVSGLSRRGSGAALGVAVLKGATFLKADVERLLGDVPLDVEWDIALDYHFGGFARVKPALLSFIEEFKDRHGIELDPLYTGKMMYGLYDLAQKGCWAAGSTVIAVHTGGVPKSHWAGLV